MSGKRAGTTSRASITRAERALRYSTDAEYRASINAELRRRKKDQGLKAKERAVAAQEKMEAAKHG